jgi:hypothetical protein
MLRAGGRVNPRIHSFLPNKFSVGSILAPDRSVRTDHAVASAIAFGERVATMGPGFELTLDTGIWILAAPMRPSSSSIGR